MAADAEAIDTEVIRVFEQTRTVLDWKGLLYGYLPNHDEDAVKRSLRRCIRRGDLVGSPGGRRGFYVHPSTLEGVVS